MAKKVFLPSDKMSLEEYLKEDLSKMRNLVADYERVRTPGKVIYDYNIRLDELIEEIIRDPRNFSVLPDFLLQKDTYYATNEEHRYFWERLYVKADPIDMRNKIERIMDKPLYRLTPAELKAFDFFVSVKYPNREDGYESMTPDLFFRVYDKVYRGHKAIKIMDIERAKFGGSVPPEFERQYQRKLADIVIGAPQIFWELPPSIKDNLTPTNPFYERMVERMDALEKHVQDVAEMRSKGEKITQEEIFRESLLPQVENYIKSVERFADEELEQRLAAQMDRETNDYPHFDDSVEVTDDFLMTISDEELQVLAQQSAPSYSQADLDAYYASLSEDQIPPEVESYEIEEDLYYQPPVDEDLASPAASFSSYDPSNFESLERSYGDGFDLDDFPSKSLDDYVFNPDQIGVDWASIDEYGQGSGQDYIFGNNDHLQMLSDEWYRLNNKDGLSEQDIRRMVEIESELGSLVAEDQSLYVFIPADIADLSGGSSPFFNSLIGELRSSGEEFETILAEDVETYEKRYGRAPVLQQREPDRDPLTEGR